MCFGLGLTRAGEISYQVSIEEKEGRGIEGFIQILNNNNKEEQQLFYAQC